jgi:FkbM family methyltransferase
MYFSFHSCAHIQGVVECGILLTMSLVSFYLRLVYLDLPRLSYRLSGDNLLRGVLLYFRFLFFLVTRKTVFRGMPMQFGLTFNGVHFTLILHNPVDIAPLVELYVRHEYNVGFTNIPKIIIDLGANYGDSTLYFHTLFPKARIFAIEPSPHSYERLRAHVAPYPSITPVHALVSDTTGSGRLNLTDSGSLGNSIMERESSTSVTVPSYTLEALITHLGLTSADLIKFDIEGAEGRIFTDKTKIASLAHTFLGEVHEDLMEVSKEDFLSVFSDFTVTLTPLKNPMRSILFATKSQNP